MERSAPEETWPDLCLSEQRAGGIFGLKSKWEAPEMIVQVRDNEPQTRSWELKTVEFYDRLGGGQASFWPEWQVLMVPVCHIRNAGRGED